MERDESKISFELSTRQIIKNEIRTKEEMISIHLIYSKVILNLLYSIIFGRKD